MFRFLMPLSAASSTRPYIIGVCGGTASGKTSVCERLSETLPEVGIVPCDAFYAPLSPEDKARAYSSDFNFDAPAAIEFAALRETVQKLRNFEDVSLPVYDFSLHARTEETVSFPRRQVVIVEGILIFNDDELRDMFDLKVFVDCDGEIRLARRVTRDINERGREMKGVFEQYFKFCKPSYDKWVEPSKRFADVILPNAGNGINEVAVDLLAKHIASQLSLRCRSAEE